MLNLIYNPNEGTILRDGDIDTWVRYICREYKNLGDLDVLISSERLVLKFQVAAVEGLIDYSDLRLWVGDDYSDFLPCGAYTKPEVNPSTEMADIRKIIKYGFKVRKEAFDGKTNAGI